MTKKIFYILRLIAIFSLSFILISCFDFVQSISYEKGIYHYYYKFTFSKDLIELSGNDVNEYIATLQNEITDEVLNISSINTDEDVGIEFSIDINPKSATENEKSLLPKNSKNKLYIPFFKKDDCTEYFNYPDDEYTQIISAILSFAKCRVFISKNIISSPEIAYFEGTGGKIFSIPIFDYGSVFCLEIPFSVFSDETMYKMDKIVIIKNE